MKRLLIILFFISVAFDARAYTYTITNHISDETVTVQVKPTGKTWNNAKSITLSPGATGEISYTGLAAGLCLFDDSIKVNGDKATWGKGNLPLVGQIIEDAVMALSYVGAIGAAVNYCGPKEFGIVNFTDGTYGAILGS